MFTYGIILASLFLLEIFYFKIADHFNIIDKPNERSSHHDVVLRGGGVIFVLGLWIWTIVTLWDNPHLMLFDGDGAIYPWLLAAVTLAAVVSFVDDIYSLPDSVRLVAQFVSMLLLFQEVGLLQWELWWMAILGLILCVGATNIYNFMDGINGITGAYSLGVLVSLIALNVRYEFMDESLLVVIGLSLIVFCYFNFRTQAKCFAGDVGSISIALLILFGIGKLIMKTGDITWLILLLVYGMDGCLTIIHRIRLHENLGEAHRKHAYQLMANELGMPHTMVSFIYMIMQLVISFVLIYVIPDTVLAHWLYLIVMAALLTLAYVAFMKKYYHLHEEYLRKIKDEKLKIKNDHNARGRDNQ